MHTKKNYILFVLPLLFMACTSNNSPKPYIFTKSLTKECHQEIEESIAELIYARKLKLSNEVFSKNSSLYLTNRRDGVLNPSPIFNDLNGRKTLNLYKRDKKLFIGLLNRDKEISKEKSLTKCK